MPFEQPDVIAAARGILAHLVEHPDAMDTVEGIQQWWLPQDAEFARHAVDAALGKLVENGWIERNILTDGRIAYTITERGLSAGSQFLREAKERAL